MNSNWGYQWAPSLTSNPCSESYPGAEAFEAVETKAVADYLTRTPNDVRAFIDVHSYGQLCMFDTFLAVDAMTDASSATSHVPLLVLVL